MKKLFNLHKLSKMSWWVIELGEDVSFHDDFLPYLNTIRETSGFVGIEWELRLDKKTVHVYASPWGFHLLAHFAKKGGVEFRVID